MSQRQCFCTMVLLLHLLISKTQAQNDSFVRSMVDTLASPYFWGRGYTKDGMNKAALFISKQFEQMGLRSFTNKTFLQPFYYNINTFPTQVKVAINGNNLVAGKDFIVSEYSQGLTCTTHLQQIDRTHFVNENNRLVIVRTKKLTWSAATQVANFTEIQIDTTQFAAIPEYIEVTITNEFVKDFAAANVCAYVKGTAKSDSFIFITAHYDHLGGMGSDVYFPGANDNASGTALLLSLAKYYSVHPLPYSIGFICFAGEEAGLLGSKYYTEHSLVPLTYTRFVINLDLEGTGEDGITIVNATEYPIEFQWMLNNNKKHALFTTINARGKAANSDHYYFTEHNVPAFFLYTLGGPQFYHDIFDRAETLPLNKINSLQKLLIQFNAQLTNATD